MTYQLDADCGLPPHLIELFLKSAPNQLQALVAWCEKRDVESARALAHKLKGSLYAAGASRLAEGIEALRATLARSDWPTVQRQIRAIRDDFAVMLLELERQLTRGAP